MNPNIVEKILEYVKGSPETMDFGMWGALNPQQRDLIKKLCNSWLVLDEATNMQTKKIERLQNIIKEVKEKIRYWQQDYMGTYISTDELDDILEILDKEENNESSDINRETD